MIAIGRYLVFIISLAGMTLSADDRFSEEEIAQFLNHILRLHHEVRHNHGVELLNRTLQLDVKASEKIDTLLSDNCEYTELHGINYRTRYFNNDTNLDAEEATKLFSEWYNTDGVYNYFFEPLNNRDDYFTQIVWKDSKEIGIAFRSVAQCYIVLVVYNPPGNIKGQFTSNVMIPPNIAEARNPGNNMFIYQGDENRFLAYILELHNAKRKEHGVIPLIRNDNLDYIASKMCILDFKPIYTDNYGINTSLRYFHDDFKMDAVEADAIFSEWYNKGANDDGSVALSNKDTAAFTHIVWKDTKTFGIAMRRFIHAYRVVALYSPPGKVRRKYKKNVPRIQYMEQGESSVNN